MSNPIRRPRSGYIKAPNPAAEARRKYPFDTLKPGEELYPAYPWEDRLRLKAAVLRWNRMNQGVLHVSMYPEKTEKYGAPCAVVGYPEGETYQAPKPRKRQKDMTIPMTNPAQNTSSE